MSCRLAFFSPKWESKIRNFTLDESQMGYVFLPSKALDFFKDENCFPVVILFEDKPVGFFVIPKFVQYYFPQVDEIVLTVNENNLAAKRLYEKLEFVYKGKNKMGRSGIELGMHYSLNV